MSRDRIEPQEGQMRSSGPAEHHESGTWTAGIDVLRSYPYRETQWHLCAIEFHHKVKEEAEALRDKWLAMAMRDSAAGTAPKLSPVLFESLLSFRPLLGEQLHGREPPLRDLIHHYYAVHISNPVNVDDLTKRYIAELWTAKGSDVHSPAGSAVTSEQLSDWFYDNGHEFVISDEEKVAESLLQQFDVRRRG